MLLSPLSVSPVSCSPCLQLATNHKNVVTRAGLSSQEAITITSLSCDPVLPGEDVPMMTVRRLGELRDCLHGRLLLHNYHQAPVTAVSIVSTVSSLLYQTCTENLQFSGTTAVPSVPGRS